MHLTLIPFIGTDSLKFETHRTAIRVFLRQFMYFTNAKRPQYDHYEKEGLILGYDERDMLEYISIIPPHSSADYSGIRFFDISLSQVLARMRELDHVVPFEDGGFDFKDVGIVLYCPGKEKLETVVVYRKGYYEDI